MTGAASGDVDRLRLDELRHERELTLAAFRDGKKSPYAAVARRELTQGQWLSFGAGADTDVQLEGLSAHHARLRVDGDSFEVEALDPGAGFSASGAAPGARTARLAAGAKVGLGRYTLRLSHQNFPAVVVLDAQSERLQSGPPPRWFPPDPAALVLARLVPDASPREEVVLSTRGNKRRALRLGVLEFTLAGQPRKLTALRLLEPGSGETSVSVFFRDRTTGHQSYPVGRYVDAAPAAGQPGSYWLDFNRAYNPSCAFSPLYNCPIPPRENVLDVEVRAGERDPGGH